MPEAVKAVAAGIPELQLAIDQLTLALTTEPSLAGFRQLLDNALESLTRLRENGPAPAPAPQLGPVTRRAIAVMTANLHRKITMPQLAAATAIAPRTLDLHFRRELRTTPFRYLHTLRLDRVRHHLLTHTEPVTISQLASAHGFVHLGRFAAAYHARYGEYPSQTRARAAAAMTSTAPQPLD